jgi:hypothetical protein
MLKRIEEFLKMVTFLSLAARAYRLANTPGRGSAYVGLLRHEVPVMAVFVGLGREAWRVSAARSEFGCNEEVRK